jgi:hypothetical protein
LNRSSPAPLETHRPRCFAPRLRSQALGRPLLRSLQFSPAVHLASRRPVGRRILLLVRLRLSLLALKTLKVFPSECSSLPGTVARRTHKAAVFKTPSGFLSPVQCRHHRHPGQLVHHLLHAHSFRPSVQKRVADLNLAFSSCFHGDVSSSDCLCAGCSLSAAAAPLPVHTLRHHQTLQSLSTEPPSSSTGSKSALGSIRIQVAVPWQ